MARKEQAKVTDTKQSSSNKHSQDFFTPLRDNFWSGIQQNWKIFLGGILLLIGVIQLRQFIVGIALVTFGVLLISGFFDTPENND